MKIRNLMAGAVAAGLMVTPLAAQAGTRASETTVSIAPAAVSTARTGAPVEDAEEFLHGWGWTLLLIPVFFISIESFTSPGIFK